MSYDVFLVYAPDDLDMANLVARRLRALKFKVRFGKKGEDPVFDDKDARDAMKSQSMLVLWSEAAVKSDWVRAAASVGHSRKDMLVQTALDETIPNEPFRLDARYDLAGFTSRTTVEGWYKTVEELGRRHGRRDLRAWIDIPNKDEEAKTVWLDAHPDDPLAQHARALRDKKLDNPPLSKADAAAVAASASAIGAPKSRPGPVVLTPPSAPHGQSSFDAKDTGWLLPTVGCGIVVLFFFAWINRTPPLAEPGVLAEARQVCPAGTVPSYLIGSQPLEPGPIINDTEDPDEE